jgi:hypothetical protein
VLVGAGASVVAVAGPPARAQMQGVAGAQPAAGALAASSSSALLSSRPVSGAAARGFELPQYGNAPGFGAGKTGFDSTNTRGKPKKNKQGKTISKAGIVAEELPALDRRSAATATTPQPPILYSQPNYVRSGAVSPVYVTTGALVPAPPPLQTPRRKRPDSDPYEPLGIRAGAFLLYPAVELKAGYDSNPARSENGGGSPLYVVAPELKLKSDWVRHELRADLRGSHSIYSDMTNLNRTTFDGKVNARLDATAKAKIDLEGRYALDSDAPGSPENPTDVRSPPRYSRAGATAGLTQGFNRFEVALKGVFDRTVYEAAKLNDGTTLDNSDRNYNQYGGTLRGSYELTPGIKPFVEGGLDTRAHDKRIDRSGFERDSDGVTWRAGTTFELTRKLTGEISAGYLTRRYEDARLRDLDGFIADASLTWLASALTTVRLTAKSAAEETTLLDVAGILKRDVGIEVEHSFRRWLIGTARFGYGVDEYDGVGRKDHRYVAGTTLTYKLNPMMQLKGEFRHEWLRTDAVGENYDASTVLFGVRLQR